MIPSPLTLNQQPVVPRLNKRIYWAGGIGLGLICLAMWSALTKKEIVRPVPEPMTVAKKELPDVLKQDPPAPAPVPVPTPQPVMQQPQQQTYRPAPQPRVATPKPPKPPKQESEKEKALREAMAASPLVIRGEGNNPQTLEIGKQIAANSYTLDGTVHAISSPYTLTAGTVIPLALVTGVNSDLPGSAFARITQDVYDSATQTHKVLPQGAQVQFRYNNEVETSQSRLFIVAERILFPPSQEHPYGSWIDLGKNPAGDSQGFSGLSDQINRHFMQAFGRALLYAGISAGAGIAQNGTGSRGFYDPYGSAGDIAASRLGRELERSATQSIRRGENISPTLVIRPGFEFAIILDKDVPFQHVWQPLNTQEEK